MCCCVLWEVLSTALQQVLILLTVYDCWLIVCLPAPCSPRIPLLNHLLHAPPTAPQEIEGQKRAKRERAEHAEEERHARMLREQIERAQKMARTDDGSEQAAAADPAATELRREELDAPLGFQLAAGRAAAAAAAAEQQQQQQRAKPAVAFEEDGGARGAAGQQRKRSKIEELMEKVRGGLVWACSHACCGGCDRGA